MPAEWDTRTPPTPTIRTVVAAVEECDAFGERLRGETDRVRVTTASDATVLADGDEWIWNLSALVLPAATGVLDVYHAIEDVATAVRAIWGDGAGAEQRRLAGGDLAGGGEGGDRAVDRGISRGGPGQPIDGRAAGAGYLANRPTRLDDAGRLGRARVSGAARWRARSRNR